MAVAIAGLLLSGCTAGLVEETVPEEAQPVELSFGHPCLEVAPAMRAEAADEALPEGTTLRIVAYRLGEEGASGVPSVNFATTAPFAQATYVVGKDGSLSPCRVDAAGKVTAGSGQPLSVRLGLYEFYAVSPARPLTNAGDETTPDWRVGGIAHKEDVMTSFVRQFTVSASNREVTLQSFVRKCARIEFNVAPAKTSETITTLRGTALLLTKLSPSGASLPAGDATAVIPVAGGVDGESGTIRFTDKDFTPLSPPAEPATDLPAGETVVAELNRTASVVLPKAAAPFDVSVTVSRNGSAATLCATIGGKEGVAFEAGKRYVFTLEVDDKTTRLLLSVSPWDTPDYGNPEAGGGVPGGPPVVDDGTAFGIVVALWKDIEWTDPSVGGK